MRRLAVVLLLIGASQLSAVDLQDSRRQLDDRFSQALEQLAAQNGLQPRQAEMLRGWFVPRDPNRQYIFVSPAISWSGGNEPSHELPEFTECRRQRAADLYRLAEQAIADGRTTVAYQLLHEVLHEDPSHEEAARILGYRPVSERELRPRRGRATHRRFGWPRGQYWILESPHFRITTNLSAQAARNLALQLEELHAVWRQVFFRVWGSHQALQDRFSGGAASLGRTPKHQVVLFRDREEYVESLLALEPNIEQSLGYYRKRQRTAFFYGEDPSSTKTRFHEVVHQLFQETGSAVSDAGDPWNFWVVEGIATYFESLARYDAGYYTLGGFDSDRLQFARARRFHGDFYMPAAELVALGREAFQKLDKQDLPKVYSQSAGLVHFLMDSEGGQFRDHCTDFLLLVYQRRDRPDTLSALLKLSFEKIDELYAEFLQVVDEDLKYARPAGEITSLALGRTGVTDTGLAQILPLRQLEWLDLSYTRVSDATARQLIESPSLRQLDLAHTRITNECLEILGQLSRLEELDLSGTAVDDDGLRMLAGARKLKRLWLSETGVTDAGLAVLRSLDELEQVDLRGTRVTEQARDALRQRLEQR